MGGAGGGRGNRKGTLTLTVANGMISEWLKKRNPSLNSILHMDGHVNKAGFSVLHQPNVAIPLSRIIEPNNCRNLNVISKLTCLKRRSTVHK